MPIVLGGRAAGRRDTAANRGRWALAGVMELVDTELEAISSCASPRPAAQLGYGAVHIFSVPRFTRGTPGKERWRDRLPPPVSAAASQGSHDLELGPLSSKLARLFLISGSPVIS